MYKFVSVSQKPHNSKLKRKYFVSVIRKFQFAERNGNTGLLSLHLVGGLRRLSS
jgi:hypothetical protein